jgi:hypothetical protein
VQRHYRYAYGAGGLLRVTWLYHNVIYITHLGWLVKHFVLATLALQNCSFVPRPTVANLGRLRDGRECLRPTLSVRYVCRTSLAAKGHISKYYAHSEETHQVATTVQAA